MKEPPYDDSLWPTLILLAFTALFAIVVVFATLTLYDNEIGPPPSSTLPKLGTPGT